MDSRGYFYQRSVDHNKLQDGQKKRGQGSTNASSPLFIKDKGVAKTMCTPNCPKCERPHKAEYLADSNACSSVGSPGTMQRIVGVEVQSPKAKEEKLKVLQGPIGSILFMATKK